MGYLFVHGRTAGSVSRGRKCPDREQAPLLQHREATQRLGLPPTSAGNHRSNGPEANRALIFNPDHSARQSRPRQGNHKIASTKVPKIGHVAHSARFQGPVAINPNSFRGLERVRFLLNRC